MTDMSSLGESPRNMMMVASIDQVRDRVISALRADPSIANIEWDGSGLLVVATLRTTWAIRAGRVRIALTPRGDEVRIEANVRIPHGVVGFTQVRSDALVERLFSRLSD